MHSLEGCQGPSTGEIFLLSSIWSLSSVSSPNFHQPHHKTDQPWLIKSNIVVIFITKHNTKPKTYSVICNDGTVESLLRILGLFLNDGLWVKAICWDCTSVYFNLQWYIKNNIFTHLLGSDHLHMGSSSNRGRTGATLLMAEGQSQTMQVPWLVTITFPFSTQTSSKQRSSHNWSRWLYLSQHKTSQELRMLSRSLSVY